MSVKNYSTSIEQHCLFCYRVLRYGKKKNILKSWNANECKCNACK